ncbi:HAMP domain-containing sensor histidine kinase [Clostridium intestinale]|uniref:histidine kinase n=1 Tax=Clostridium intestinale DSM 6191 TaxID=1121320 RepID=A0A1M6F6P4_9CLOT|nr:HAMP domain-containing sensor histidine kinase [Clostridium intestinale]SHI93388.1 Signal transduction histidine kinase [Clostridium intestinale DSM 6191]
MKNNKGKYDKEIEYITNITTKIFKESVKLIKEQYKVLITKVRLSIVLKLNVMYVLVCLNLLFFINLFITGIYGYFTFTKINSNIEKSFVTISKELKETENLSIDRLYLLKETNGYEIIIYDNNKEILYRNSEAYINDLSKDNVRVLAYGHFKFQNNISEETIKNNINSIFNINYIYDRAAEESGSKFNIQIKYNLYEDFSFLGNFILWVVIAEMVCLFLSLGNVKSRSKKILKPIDDMNKTVENITIKQIDTRLSVGGTQDELKDLAKTFNGMLDRIQEAYNIQNQFVSDASHELRTPIAVIQGYARLLDRWGKEDKEALEESISAIKSEANNMKDLVEKLLFLARGDKNTQPVIMEEFDLNFLVDELLKETKLIDNDHNISCDKNEVVKIYADEKLLKQAFRIFLDNSIKYTPKGGNIGISTYVNGNNVEIVIKDNGIGIDEKDIPKIFDRFYRADESRTRETGGNGLGLSIAKWIIMKHKGKITVNSSLNVGTTIIINLPMNT